MNTRSNVIVKGISTNYILFHLSDNHFEFSHSYSFPYSCFIKFTICGADRINDGKVALVNTRIYYFMHKLRINGHSEYQLHILW